MDLRDPFAPRLLAKVDDATGLMLDADTPWIGWTNSANRTISRLDLADPSAPERKETITLPEGASWLAVAGNDFVFRTGNKVWLARRAGDAFEKAADLLETGSRCVLAQFRGEYLDVIDGCNGSGQYSLGYKSARSRWLVFRRNDPTAPVRQWEAPYPSAFSAITVDGATAYVFDYNYGLHTFDLTDPAQPKPIGGCMSAGEGHCLALVGDRAYLGQTFGGGLTIMDISDPTQPRRTGEFWDGCWFNYENRVHTQIMAGVPGAVYIAKQADGIHVLDVANPDAPRDVGKVDGSHLIVSGGHLITGVPGKVLLYDVANPLAPALAGSVDLPDAKALCRLVAVEKDLLCAAEGNGGTRVFTIDIADPRAPRLVGQLDLKDCEGAQPVNGAIALADGYLYLGPVRGKEERDNTSLIVVDVRDPAAPKFVRTFDPYPPGLPNRSNSTWANFYGDLVVGGGYMFAGNYGQIECFDLSEPGNPRFVGLSNTGFQWSAGELRDGFLYVPALVGLVVVRVPQK